MERTESARIRRNSSTMFKIVCDKQISNWSISRYFTLQNNTTSTTILNFSSKNSAFEFAREVLYILESNPHPFYSFRGLKNQMLTRIACGLDSRSRAGFWKNDRAAVRDVRTIQ